MGTFELKMPKLGESITEGIIIAWAVKEGDTVNEDDKLFEVSTAKVSAEIPSPVAGKISKLLHKEGDTVPVGETVALIQTSAGGEAEAPAPVETAAPTTPAPMAASMATSVPATPASAAASAPAPAPVEEKAAVSAPAATPAPVAAPALEATSASAAAPASVTASASISAAAPPVTAPQAAVPSAPVPVTVQPAVPEKVTASGAVTVKKEGGAERWYSPAVLQLAKEAGIAQAELDAIPGTGYQDRLSKKDMTHYIESRKPGYAAPVPVAGAPVVPTSEAGAPATPKIPAAPAAVPSPVPSHPAVATEMHPSVITLHEGDTVKEMDYIRRVTAEHMVMSKHTSAHVTTFVEVDVTKLVQWRSRTKDEFQKREGITLTYMPAITEAVAKTLAEYPQVNASVDGHNIVYRKHINIGIAVALENWNLVVPVIHDADKLNISGLAQQIDSLAQRARSKKLTLPEIEGGTFTITNFGSFRNLFGTPIINQPEVAVLGVGYIVKKPVVMETPDGDVIAVRHMMYLSLSYDHRVVDGALGGQFLRRLADHLEGWNA